MHLLAAQQKFLDKRKKLIVAWRWIGPLLLVAVLATLAWLFSQRPLLINPYEVINRIESGTIEGSTLALMAAMLPMLVLMSFLLVFAIIIFTFSAFTNEKNYRKIIDALAADG